MPEDAKATEKVAEKGTVGEKERSAAESAGIWICPWCGKDCLSERNYYYHLRHCDACPEDGVADKNRPSVDTLKKEESFIINIFEDRPVKEPPEEKSTVAPPATPEATPETKVEEEAPYVCGYCKAGLKTKAKYCPNCGTPLEWASG